jgi:hypothetical protein
LTVSINGVVQAVTLTSDGSAHTTDVMLPAGPLKNVEIWEGPQFGPSEPNVTSGGVVTSLEALDDKLFIIRPKAPSRRVVVYGDSISQGYPVQPQASWVGGIRLSPSFVGGGITSYGFVCGRYEGIDARVKKVFKVDEVSVGPFVLTGGEIPAMLLIDSISRQVKGVLGDFASLEESRIAAKDAFTRPDTIEFNKKKYRVPPVLLSGHQAKIDEWRKNNAENN